MEFRVLQAVRDRLQTDEALAAFFAEEFPSNRPHYLIGLKPDEQTGTAVPADFFPYIAVSPLRHSQPANPGKDLQDRVSILCGVFDDREEAGVFLGLPTLCELVELILKALEPQPLGTGIVWNAETEVFFDAGLEHPWYEAEITPTLQVRK